MLIYRRAGEISDPLSLFTGSLSFEEAGVKQMFAARLGIISGLLASGIAGYLILRASLSSARD